MTTTKGRTTEAWKNEPREGHANYDQWVTSLWYDNDEGLYKERQEIYQLAMFKADARNPEKYLRPRLTRYIHRAAAYAARQEHTGVYLVKADVQALLDDLLGEYREFANYEAQKTADQPHTVYQDETPLHHAATYNDAWTWILKNQSASVDHAMKYEGYSIRLD